MNKFNIKFKDAADSMFMSRQLEHVRREVQNVRFPELKARSLLFWDREMDPGAETFRYYQYERIGRAKVMDPGATDIPKVTIKGAEFTGQIRHILVGYDYTLQDARKAMFAKQNLSMAHANTAFASVEQLFEQVAQIGSANDGLLGLANQTNALTYTTPNGTLGSPLWANKTSDEIIADLNGVQNKIPDSTNQVEVPNTIVLPAANYNLIAGKRLGDGSDVTILEHFLKVSQYVKRVEKWVGLETLGSGVTTRAIAYRNDKEAVRFICPMEFTQGLPLQHKTTIETVCEARTGGVVAELPKSICYMDGI